jgi:hypothetical protein
MKNRSYLIPLLSLFAPLLSVSSALAYDTDCATFSRGLLFKASHSNAGYAQNVALNNCKTSGNTFNSECDSNLVCTVGPQAIDRCSTFSRALLFESSSDVRGFARHQAIARCKSSGNTWNTECDSNVHCELERPGPGGNPYPSDPYPSEPYPSEPYPSDPYPSEPYPSEPRRGEIRAYDLVGQWRASNCNYCFLQVSIHEGKLYGDMVPWETNQTRSGGPRKMLLLTGNLLQYRGDIFRIERVGGRRSSQGLRIVNTSQPNGSRNVRSAELESYRPAPNPGPIPPRPRQVTCTLRRNGQVYTATQSNRSTALSTVLARCAADARGYVCRSSDAVCTQ